MNKLPEGFVAANHKILFDDDAHRCDVCNELIDPQGDGNGYDVGGRGLLLWTRGDERRYFEPPLCPRCATAIGVTALHRWEIEEEEG
ncbi:MAG: hypothetical protein FWD73_10435 [Polyangiaceae bacterium]|nr:hypothetical protein [Polyangiaceae bacterium]